MRGRDNSTVGREVRTDRTRILKQFPCGRPAGGWRTKGECADCGLALAIGSSTCRFQDHESVKLAFDRFVAPLGNQDLPCRADVVWLRLYIGPIRPPVPHHLYINQSCIDTQTQTPLSIQQATFANCISSYDHHNSISTALVSRLI